MASRVSLEDFVSNIPKLSPSEYTKTMYEIATKSVCPDQSYTVGSHYSEFQETNLQ